MYIDMPFKVNPSYARPEVVKKIYELRTKGEPYHNIAAVILEEFDLKITDPTIKNIYERYVAKNMVVQAAKEGKLAQEIVPDFQKKMEERFDRVTQVTDDLMDTLVELKKNIPPMLYVKFIPTILMVCREILNQLSYIKKEQTQVLINQKNVIYSPLQIMNILNQEMIKLEKEGKIEIKDTTGDRYSNNTSFKGLEAGRILSNDEKKHIVFSKIKTEEEIEMEQRQKESEEKNEETEKVAA
jgi:hypothetical protein